jgi:hypothetical protein
MTVGATVTGRLLCDGKPVPGAAAGLMQTNRSADTFLGSMVIGTQPDGRFTFLNVFPGDDYSIYGLMESFKDGGAAAARRIHVAGEGVTTDIGDLPVTKGHRIKGRVLLSDGKPIPPRTRLLISREDAWDTQRVDLDQEGRFEIAGLPTERYSLSVRIRGYRLSPKNHGIDPQNHRLLGTIDQDIDTLKILFEPDAR